MTKFVLGIIAGTLCTISFIPQLVQVAKTKKARDLSLFTFTVFPLGVLLWLIYGIMIDEAPVIIANSVTLALLLVLAAMKVKYG